MDAARSREARLDLDIEAMLEAFPAGVMVFDRNRDLVYANREAMRIVGIRSFEEAAALASGTMKVGQLVMLDGST